MKVPSEPSTQPAPARRQNDVVRPPIPRDEDERLAALRRLALLEGEPSESFERIGRIARRVFGVRWAVVTLLDEERQWFVTRQGTEERWAQGTSRAISFSGHVVAAGRTIVVEDARADERFFDNPLVTEPGSVVAYAGAPIRSPDGPVVGVFCVAHDARRAFSAEELEMLEDLAALVEREIDTHYRACLDEVTGVYNRRGFVAIGRHALARAAARGIPLALAYLDVDGLKSVNDRHGHGVGDHALLAVGHALRSTTRASDVIGRLGGDEFALLLFDCTIAGADHVIAALESRFAAELATVAPGLRIGLSAGAADVTPGASLEEVLALADARMYERKAAKPRA